MRIKIRILIYPLLIMGVLLVFVYSCNIDDNIGSNRPILSTSVVTSITQTSAICGGDISSDGGAIVTARGVCWSTEQTPTISDNKTTDGTGTGVFVSNISGLTANTNYYARSYATNSNGTAYGSSMSFTTESGLSVGSFTDLRDGNDYQTVTIGTQVWMAENLAYLPNVVGPGTGSPTSPYYYVYSYNGNSVSAAKGTSTYTTYGVLYNWPAAKNACPSGWHLPSDTEWTKLTTYLGGEFVAGGKLKESGTSHWNWPNTNATNETGYTALPGGDRNYNGTFIFSHLGSYGSWWSATGSNAEGAAWYRGMNNIDIFVYRNYYNKEMGYSVRCVKD